MDNQTVVDTIVKYSKECIIRRYIKDHLQKSILLARMVNLPSANGINILIDEIDFRINERETDIGRLLKPLFEGKDFGHIDSKKHSLTLSELRDGYMLLGGEQYVIFLREAHSPDSGMKYYPGVLYQIDDINEKVLPLLKSKIEDDFLNVIIKRKNAYEYIK